MKFLLFLSICLVAVWADNSCPVVATDSVSFLVASASANTGGSVVRELSAKGYQVKALFRKTDSDKAKALAALPGVTIVQGDFGDLASINKALVGVSRALLVAGAFAFEQFDQETDFLAAAKAAGVEAVVRISTATCLIHPGTQGAYGRAHHGIEAFAAQHDIPCINIRSNWFFDNWMLSAAEIKEHGQISFPVKGDGARVAMVDPRDVASASAAILALPSDQLSLFLAARNIEVHGPALVNFQDVANALSKVRGSPVTINTVPADAWQKGLEGFGIPRTFARSFLHTVQEVAGDRPSHGPRPQTTSPLLTAMGWKAKHDVHSWAADVKGVFA